MSPKRPVCISDIPGIKIGHAHDETALTGCTVILAKDGAVGGVDQRGGAPGTRETDLLRPMHLVEKVHAVVLAGGSAYGLDAASGVMRYLEENGIGLDTGPARVPIVPSAILYDLGIGKSDVRPDAQMGYLACENASNEKPAEGNVGAGIGATVGKLLGMGQSMKSGIGTAAMEIGGGIIIGAIIAVNAFGDVVDPNGNRIIAGVRSIKTGPIKVGDGEGLANSLSVMKSMPGRIILNIAAHQNTVIGAIITNANLNKEEVNKVAQMGQDGLARVIRPAHTLFDGDTIFALATGKKRAEVSVVGSFAAEVVSEAILNAVWAASSIPGFPSARDFHNQSDSQIS